LVNIPPISNFIKIRWVVHVFEHKDKHLCKAFVAKMKYEMRVRVMLAVIVAGCVDTVKRLGKKRAFSLKFRLWHETLEPRTPMYHLVLSCVRETVHTRNA
jgi:hypothetical protein